MPGKKSLLDSEAPLSDEEKPKKKEARDDGSQSLHYSSSGIKILSLKLTSSKNASPASRGYWLLDHVASQPSINVRSSFVAFVMVFGIFKETEVGCVEGTSRLYL